jgi:hypothetical protein
MKRYCLWAQKISIKSGKIKGGASGEGKMGEGWDMMGKTEGNYITQDQYTSSKRNQQGQWT